MSEMPFVTVGRSANRSDRSIIENLGDVGLEIAHSDSPQKQVLEDTYRLLEEAIGPWPTNSGIMKWPLEVSEDFLDLLKQGNWFARLLLLFHGLGLHLCSTRWFIGDAGRRSVLAILPRKSEIPPRWRDLISWIGEVVEVAPVSI